MRTRLITAGAAATAALAAGIAVGTAVTPSHASDSGAAKATTVRCAGSTTTCTATVSLAGGASNERVVITLPGTGMRLESVKPTSSNLDGAYMVSDQKSVAGGEKYAFTLNAAEAPKGSTLKLTFHKPKASSSSIIRCKGGTTECTAKVGIGGGASNRHVVVQLPRTDLALVSVKPSSTDLKGAYSLTGQKLRKGGSEYEFTLSAVAAVPAGSTLTLTFARP